MPKKSKKSKSKRLTLKDKHKIIKKVKEHHRKQRKESKKRGRTKPSLLKDPGIPANHPHREQIVKEMKFEQARILAKEAQKREEKKQRRLAREAGNDGDQDEEMAVDTASEMMSLRLAAKQSQSDFETRAQSGLTAEISGDHDNSRKWFYKEFKKVVGLADVVLQVLDARDPLSCRSEDIERYIRSVNPNKRVILILNKVDLIPREVAESWLRYFRKELPCVAFKAATKKSGAIGQGKLPVMSTGAQKRSVAETTDTLLNTSECLGADTLLQLLKNYSRNANVKTTITVGVVGMPNVGKSSIINSLKRTKVAQVGNTPGVTKAVQEIHLDKQIRLLDSPGVVFASAENEAAAALRNCVKVEKLADPITPVSEILKRVPAKRLMHIYSIGAFDSAEGMLQQIAAARGKLRKGGTVDTAAAARIVLSDWNDGKVPFFTRPPVRGDHAHDSATVVQAYAADFDADTVFANEASAVIAGLSTLDSGSFVEAAPGQAVHVRFLVNFDALESEAAADDGAMEASDCEDIYDDPDADQAGPSGSHQHAQNAALYGEAGQYNPKAAKASKKKARKAARAATSMQGQAYDFSEHWEKGEQGDAVAMDAA